MADAPTIPRTRRQTLIARGEQTVLVLVALAVVAGVLWRAADHWRLGREPLEVLPAADASFRVNVNAAEWHELALVPGLGETLSKRILTARDARPGRRFASIEDLKAVHGIGDKTLAKLRPYLDFGDADAAEPIHMIGAKREAGPPP